MKVRLKLLLLGLAVLTAGLAVFAQSAQAGQYSPNSSLNVKLNPDNSTSNVVAQRLHNSGLQDTYTLKYSSSKHQYESGELAGTGGAGAGCDKGNQDLYFKVVVRDKPNGTIVGSNPNIFVGCDTDKNVTVNVQSVPVAQQNGALKGRLMFYDPGASPPTYRPFGQNSRTTITLTGPSNTVPSIDNNGYYSANNLKPGSYTLDATYAYVGTDPVDQMTAHIHRSGITVTAGQTTTLDLYEGQDSKTGDGAPPAITGSGGGGGNNPPPKNGNNCDAADFTWLVCPLIDYTQKGVDAIEKNIIAPFLQTPPLVSNSSDPVYAIWVVFRNLANGAFVLAFIVIIFSNTLSIGLDNYTIKKMLPRLFAAAFFVQFSFLFASLAVDFVNIVGVGLISLVNTALVHACNDPHSATHCSIYSNQAGVVTLTLGIGAAIGFITLSTALIAGALTGAILILIISAFFAMIGIFLTLLFRKVLIAVLIVVSPLALVAWILPNTERLFKVWYQNLSKALLMYPMIVMLFAGGEIVKTVAGAQGGDLGPAFALAGLIAPLFMIPGTFKAAGSLMAASSKAFNDLSNRGRSKWEDSGAAQRLKTTSERRKTELAAGQGVNIFGKKIGTGRAGMLAGRGLLGTRLTEKGKQKSNARATSAFLGAKGTGAAQKELEEAGLGDNAEAAMMIAGGEDALKVLKDQAKGDVQKQAELDSLYKQTRRFSNATHKAAAAGIIGKAGLASDDSRQWVRQSLGDTAAGQQLWRSMAVQARSSDSSQMFTTLDGHYNQTGHAKYLAGQNQNFLAGQTAGAMEKVFSQVDANGNIVKQPDADGKMQAVLRSVGQSREIISTMGGGDYDRGIKSLHALMYGPGSRINPKAAGIISQATGISESTVSKDGAITPPDGGTIPTAAAATATSAAYVAAMGEIGRSLPPEGGGGPAPSGGGGGGGPVAPRPSAPTSPAPAGGTIASTRQNEYVEGLVQRYASAQTTAAERRDIENSLSIQPQALRQALTTRAARPDATAAEKAQIAERLAKLGAATAASASSTPATSPALAPSTSAAPVASAPSAPAASPAPAAPAAPATSTAPTGRSDYLQSMVDRYAQARTSAAERQGIERSLELDPPTLVAALRARYHSQGVSADEKQQIVQRLRDLGSDIT